MPAIYTSYLPEPDDDLDTRMKKIYLGMISLGEDLYTFNASLNEMRKEYTDLDKRYTDLQEEYRELKNCVREKQ